MRVLVVLALLAAASFPVLAQSGRPAPHPPHHPAAQRPMPPPERRMGWEERQRLREQVRSGQMTREEARARWREHRNADPGRSQEQREQLRRDVIDADRDLHKR
ncbi:MAG: hypothetical protein IT513_04625 [Burkholderiales bacterium]|nr:hypothetical protein [Burkholderiales bacterium]